MMDSSRLVPKRDSDLGITGAVSLGSHFTATVAHEILARASIPLNVLDKVVEPMQHNNQEACKELPDGRCR
jgi:hypothetical protein